MYARVLVQPPPARRDVRRCNPELVVGSDLLKLLSKNLCQGLPGRVVHWFSLSRVARSSTFVSLRLL